MKRCFRLALETKTLSMLGKVPNMVEKVNEFGQGRERAGSRWFEKLRFEITPFDEFPAERFLVLTPVDPFRICSGVVPTAPISRMQILVEARPTRAAFV